MSATRRLASKLLRAILRHSSADSQEWANAMLRELDFIENDWAALFWALGSTTAIFRRSGRGLKAWLGNYSEEGRMNSIGKRAVGVASGVAIAGMLVLCAFGLLLLSAHLFPGLGLDHLEWTHWLTVIVIPEVVFIIAAVALWRKKGPLAVGILLSAVMLAMHFVIHLTTSLH
jgi:hypothetical protein